MFNFILKNTVFLSLPKFEKISKKISKELKSDFILLNKKEFANSEILIYCQKPLEGKDVFFIHSTGFPVNETMMELFIALDSISNLKPKSINLILPFLAYGRQDRKTKIGEPITAQTIAKLIESFDIKNIITFNLHSEKTKSFFSGNLINLNFTNILVKKILDKKIKNLSLVAPDLGKKEELKELSNKLNIPMIQMFKKRPKDNQTVVIKIEGEIKNRNLLLIDDMIDTGNTLLNSIKILKEKKANDIYILATHGIFSKDAIERFENSYKNKIIKKILISNTIIQIKKECFEIVSISDYLIRFFKKVKDKNTLKKFLLEEELKNE